VLAIAAVGAAAAFLGGNDDGPVPPTPSSPAPTARPAADVCDVISEQMQVFRVDQLERAATALQQDAARLREQGARTRAASVDGVVEAIHGYQDVARGGGDTQAATSGLLDALDAIDWC
jgi:hypothetical protein